MSKTKFDMERLQELHDKAQSNELTDEEIVELQEMLDGFVEEMKPVVESFVAICSEAASNAVGAIKPIAEQTHDDSNGTNSMLYPES